MPHSFSIRYSLTKKLFYILIGLLYPITSYADCSETGLSIFPRGSMIRQNSIFILEAFSESQYVIAGLNKAYPIYLQSADKKVRLLVTELLKGEHLLSQAILKPESELEAGLEYTLIIENLQEPERVSSNFGKGAFSQKTYTVLAGKDVTIPHLTSKPKIIKKPIHI